MSRFLGFSFLAAFGIAGAALVHGLAPDAFVSDTWAPPSAHAGDAEAREELVQRFDTLDREDAAAAYRLALELEAAGAMDLARKACEIVIGIDPDHIAARRMLGFEQIDERWLAGDELQRAKGFVRHQDRWMTSEEFAAATRPEREAKEQQEGEARVLGLLALIASGDDAKIAEGKRKMELEAAKFKLAPLAKALRCEPASLRIYAARELGRLADPLAAPALLRRAVEDKERDVRVAVVEALKELGSPSTVHPLGRALDSRFREIRVNAAEALALLGDELAYPYIVKKWEGRSGDFPRSYFSTVRQISYIQDFDVEVAQTSFIADPIVGVLSDGVVQSVKILATEQSFFIYERPAFHGALKSLAGTDLGNKVGAWKQFWQDNAQRLLDERAARYEKLAAERRR
ncbi:MAG: HEAT repeat domain-containing protein [Planctomycetota bacterium]|nr:HEAT repeat domain-containing protein [Planctomycetota bacterium]